MADKTLAWAVAESTARLAWLGLGSGNAYLLLYGSAKPTVAGAAPGGSPLLRIDLAEPAGIVQADGSLVLLLASAPVVGLAAGSAVWARLFNGADEPGLDMLVSTFSGMGEVKISRLNIVVGTPAKVVLATLK